MVAEASRPATLNITVVRSEAPRQVRELSLRLPAGSTVADALKFLGALLGPMDEAAQPLEVGIWGRKVPPQQPLRDRDRLEIYRALRVDPKVARRERFARQGTRSAGLFARKRTSS